MKPRVEYLNARDLAMTAVGNGSKKKTANRRLDSLEEIKTWGGLSKSKFRIKRLKDQLELADSLSKVIKMNQYQTREKNVN